MILDELAWVNFFGEMVKKIRDRDNQYLIEKVKQVKWKNKDDDRLLQYGNEGIDPLSFIYSLAQKNTINQFAEVFGSVGKVFKLSTEPPPCIQVMPTLPSGWGALFHDGRNFSPELLWKIFSDTVTGEIYARDFTTALNLPNVEVSKLTQTLFLVNPHRFLPFDTTSERFSGHVKSDLKKDNGYESYKSAVEIIRQKFPECKPFEINYFLYVQKDNPLITKRSNFFQISSQAYGEYGDNPDYWDRSDGVRDFKNHYCVFTGGPLSESGKTEYPVKSPKRGDIVLVRSGQSEGRGIGVVVDNGYQKNGWTEESQIDVIWINKSIKEFNKRVRQPALTQVGPDYAIYRIFSDVNEYSTTLQLISRIVEEINPMHNYPLNTILFGPPGTGKTWHSKNLALSLVLNRAEGKITDSDRQNFKEYRFEVNDDDNLSGQIAFTTFHQNYAYEDFVEGIRPVMGESQLEYKIRDGIFKKIADTAAKNENQHLPYVLIIDEINRGNIAKIFGELITLIEDSKRLKQPDAQYVILPYSQEQFAVPQNLYVIGTMNTADRSIQILDTALRRRFNFVEMMPDVTHSDICTDINGINCSEMLSSMNKRIFLMHDRERQIGHTYLLNVREMERLVEVFKYRIIPLLQEYFYNDWSKIRTVLGNNDFVQVMNIEHETPGDSQTMDMEKFELLRQNDPKWNDPQQYIKIYA